MNVSLRKYARFSVLFPLIMVILSIAFMTITSSYPERSGIFPMFILYILLGASLWQFVIELVKAYKLEPVADDTPKEIRRAEAWKLWSTVIGIVLYVWLIFMIGFGLSTLIFVTLLSKLLGVRRWLVSILLAVGTYAFIYFIFSYIFSIPLPRGSLIQLPFL